MLIERLQVWCLNDRPDVNLDLTFHPDVNILTGKNGSGKTTVLKLLWFLISGNVEHLLDEIKFRRIRLQTDVYTVDLEVREGEGSPRAARNRAFPSPASNVLESPVRWTFERAGEIISFPPPNPRTFEQMLEVSDTGAANILNKQLFAVPASSIFFPTFRRVEGGFSMGRGRGRGEYDTPGPNLSRELARLSDRLTVLNHRFIASISTEDIVKVLTEYYANTSERINEDHKSLSREITDMIRRHESQASNADANLNAARAGEVLDAIQSSVRDHSKKQEGRFHVIDATSRRLTGRC